MNQNVNQSKVSRRATSQSPILREYPLRNIDKKTVYNFDESSDEESEVHSPIRANRSWSLDPQTNDSDPGYSSLNESKLGRTVGHSNPESVNTDYQLDPDVNNQPPVPKVILKRSYPKIGDVNDDYRESFVKRHRGRPRKHFYFGQRKDTSRRPKHLNLVPSRGSSLKRPRGRPRKQLESESGNAFSTTSNTLHKINANPEFFYGDEYNFVTDVATYPVNDKVIKVNAPIEAKDTLQKQVQLKRRLSCDKGVPSEQVKDGLDNILVKLGSDKQKIDGNIEETVVAQPGASNDLVKQSTSNKKSGCRFCALNRQVKNSDGTGKSGGEQTINIDRCLNWAYQLSNTEWTDFFNNLSLLKSKYPVLKILFKRNPGIHLVDLKYKWIDERKRNSMASRKVLKDKKEIEKQVLKQKIDSEKVLKHKTEIEKHVLKEKAGSEKHVLKEKTEGEFKKVLKDKTGSEKKVLKNKTGSEKQVLKDKTESKSNLVDPRVVPWSRSLISNGTGRKGIEKIFKKNKSKTFEQFANRTSQTVSRSRHNVDFKQRLKEACKPKPKKMDKLGHACESAKSAFFKRKDHSVKSLKEYYSVKQTGISSNINSDSTDRSNYRRGGNSDIAQDRQSEAYRNESSQHCSTPGSPRTSPGSPGSRTPIGSPGPPHLEKEMVRNMDDCYGNSEMEILKMNDFEIEICRDDMDESMPEVLDMRIGVRESNDTKMKGDSNQDHNDNTSLPQLTVEKPIDNSYHTNPKEGEEKTYTYDSNNVDSYISRYSHLAENLELNVDDVSAADVNAFPSPSNLVIQNVCSLNQEYNKSTDFSHSEPNIYNQRILEMLDGEIFDTNMFDAAPLDLVKTTKQTKGSEETDVSTKRAAALYTSDSDETMVYSDASEENLELSTESETLDKNSQMSPRLKALKSTKNSISVSIDDSSSNDSDSLASNDAAEMLLALSQNRSQLNECSKGNIDEVFNDKDNTGTSEKVCSINKQKSTKLVTEFATTHMAQERNMGITEDDVSDQTTYTENDNTGLEIQKAVNEMYVRHAKSGNGLRDSVSSNESDIEADTEEYDGHCLVINETASEPDDAETVLDDVAETEKKPRQPRGPKSLSFVRNLGKNKQIRDFMHKEKERRRSLNRDGRMPKLLLKANSRNNSNEDPEDLPQILPPKRRQRAPKSLSHQETRALSKPANLERIMADFPKHNWLFDKYNSVSKEDATGGCENKQNQDVYADASLSVETITSSSNAGSCITPQAGYNQAVTASTAGSYVASQPLTDGYKTAGSQAVMSSTTGSHVQAQPIVGRCQIHGQQAVDRDSPEFYGQQVDLNGSRNLASVKLHHTKAAMTDSENVSENLARNPVSSAGGRHPMPTHGRFISTFTPCTSGGTTWQPVKEHDPTLASLSMDTSPKSFTDVGEMENGDKIPINSETLSVNENAQKVCIVSQETALASVKRLSLVCGHERNPNATDKWSQEHYDVQRNLENVPDMSNLYASSCMPAQVNSIEGQSSRRDLVLDTQVNSKNGQRDRRELILDRKLDERELTRGRKIDEKQFFSGNSQENPKPSIQVPKPSAGNKVNTAEGQHSEKSENSGCRLDALRPETIEAIKRGNPGLVKSHLPVNTKKLDKADESCIYINDVAQSSEKIQMASSAEKPSDITKPFLNTLQEMEEHLAVIDNQLNVMSDKVTAQECLDEILTDVHNLNKENGNVSLSNNTNNKENRSKINGPSETRITVEKEHQTPETMTGSDVENKCYPLNVKQATQASDTSNLLVKKARMKQSPTAISHEQLSTETWKDEMVSELLSYESSVGDTEDMMLPLDLCINRNVTENSFATYRKHHPPPVQLVHPQVKKPPSSEAIPVTADVSRVPEEITVETPKDDDNEEDLQSNVIQNTETPRDNVGTLNVVDNREVEIDTSFRNLNVVSELSGKVSELQSTVPAPTLVPTAKVCESRANVTAAKVAPSCAPVPAIQKFVGPVPAVSQQRPVIIHPVQQMNPAPRNIRSRMIQPQPRVTVHSMAPTAADLLQRQRNAMPPVMSSMPERFSNSQTFQPMPQARHVQPIHAGSQAHSNFGNIQLVIPAGQLLLPIQSPTVMQANPVMQANAVPLLQTYGTRASQPRPRPKPRRARQILPKSDESPSKKQKLDQQESDSQIPSDSLSDNGREFNKAFDNSAIISADKNRFISKNEASYVSSESLNRGFMNNKERNGSSSEESTDVKQGDSSDDNMDVDDDLLHEMEEYKKLREERKRKEKEEMEMRKKLLEKMKLAKARKQAALNTETKSQAQHEDLGDSKSSSVAVLPSYKPKENVNEDQSLKNEIKEGIDSLLGKGNDKDSPDEDRTVEVIAEWNVPMSGATSVPMTGTISEPSSNVNNIQSVCNSAKDETCGKDLEAANAGLDLRISQQTSRSESISCMTNNAGCKNSTDVSSKSGAEEANFMDMSISAATNMQKNDSGLVETPHKQDEVIDPERLQSNEDNSVKAASGYIPSTKEKDKNKSPVKLVTPQIQNNITDSVKPSQNKQDLIYESEGLQVEHGDQAESNLPINESNDILNNEVEDQNKSPLNQSGYLNTTSMSSDSNSELDTPISVGESVTNLNHITEDNNKTPANQIVPVNTTSVILPSVSNTTVTIGESLTIVQNKNLVTDIELEQRPYSPPLLKPRPVSWLERMKQAASSLGSDSRQTATTSTTSACRLSKPPNYIPNEKLPVPQRSNSSGAVESSVSTHLPLTIIAPVPTIRLRRVYSVSPKPGDYKEFTASPIIDNVEKLDRPSKTTVTGDSKEFTGSPIMDNVEKLDKASDTTVTAEVRDDSAVSYDTSMTKSSIDVVVTKNNDPVVVSTSSQIYRDEDKSETTEFSESSNRPTSDRNIFSDISRINDKNNTGLEKDEIYCLSLRNAIPSNKIDTNNGNLDIAVDSGRKIDTAKTATESRKNKTATPNKENANMTSAASSKAISTDEVSIKAFEANTACSNDIVTDVEKTNIAVQKTTDIDANSIGVDLTTSANDRNLNSDMTSGTDKQREKQLISNRMDISEKNNKDNDELQTCSKEMSVTDSEDDTPANVVADVASSLFFATSTSASLINESSEGLDIGLLDLSKKHSPLAAIESPRCSTVLSPSSTNVSSVCTKNSISGGIHTNSSSYSRSQYTTYSSNYSTNDVSTRSSYSSSNDTRCSTSFSTTDGTNETGVSKLSDITCSLSHSTSNITDTTSFSTIYESRSTSFSKNGESTRPSYSTVSDAACTTAFSTISNAKCSTTFSTISDTTYSTRFPTLSKSRSTTSLCTTGDTTCSSSISPTGVMMSVIMSAGVQQSDKNMRPQSAGFAAGIGATDCFGSINSDAIPKSNAMVFSKSVSESASIKSPTVETGTNDNTSLVDYSMKPQQTIKVEENETESLSNYKSFNLMRRSPCSSSSSFYVTTTSSTSPVSISPAGYSSLSNALKHRLNNGGKRIILDIPEAHSTKPRPEKIPKGAKAPLAHNNTVVTSMKSLIKIMNRTMCLVPSQIRQTCPYFKKALQYNWSPSPKDTYRSKMARRETPVAPPAHNQKPFGIAGTLITPAGRFIRKRSRSVEMKGMECGPSNTPSLVGNQQLNSPTMGGNYSSTSYPPYPHSPTRKIVLPPIRAHVHIEGTVDTVTLTNTQKPGAVTPTGLPRLSPRDYSKKCDVIDLTVEGKEPVQRDGSKQVDQGDDGQMEDAERQIQQELSEAVAKRQKLENGKTMVEQGGMLNNSGNDPDNADYSQDENVRRRKRARSHSFSFQMNRPILPSGGHYQPMHGGQSGQGVQRGGPPNVTLNQNYNSSLREQPRSYLDVETNSLRSVLQASPEDIQAHLRHRQNTTDGSVPQGIDGRVPPLITMREAARMSQTMPQPGLQPISQPMSQPYNYPAQQTNARPPSDTNYQFQPRGMMRPQGGRAQQPPGLVNHYLVPARNNGALLSPRVPTRPVGSHQLQRQLPMIAAKPSYAGSGPHGAAMMSSQGVGLSPRQRFPPPPYQRNGSGPGQYGPSQGMDSRSEQGQVSPQDMILRQMQGTELRSDQGQVSPQGQFMRVPAPNNPNYPGYGNQGQRSHSQDARQLMRGPQQYHPARGQGHPGNHMRYSPGQTVRDYRYSPVKNQGHSSRSYMNMPQGHSQGQASGMSGMQDHQMAIVPASMATMDKYGNDVRLQGQGQEQVQRSPHQQRSPQVHPDTSPQAWSHSGYSPQGQRQHYSMSQERITPPAYPSYSTQPPTMHQNDKAFPVPPGHGQSAASYTASYSSGNQQAVLPQSSRTGLTSVTMATPIQGQGQMGVSKNNAGSQIMPDQNFVRNPNVPYNVYVNRKPMNSQNNHSHNSCSQNVVYQESRVPGTQQQLPRQQLSQEVPQYQTNQNIPNQRQMPASQSYIVVSGGQEPTRLPIRQGQKSHHKQQLLGNQPMMNVNGNQFSNNSNHGNQLQVQQQEYGNDYKQQETQPDQMLPSNQGHGNQMGVNGDPDIIVQTQPLNDNLGHTGKPIHIDVDTQIIEQPQQLADNQGHQRNVTALTSPRGQGDTVEVIEVEEEDYPHLQQVHSSCVLCGKFSLYLCSNCKEVWYCSPACQMSHWEMHSLVCQGDGN